MAPGPPSTCFCCCVNAFEHVDTACRMRLIHPSGPTDPQIAEYRQIAEPELVKTRGLFVAEGRLVVQRAIEYNPRAVRSVLVNQAACQALEAVLATLPAATPIYLCDSGD